MPEHKPPGFNRYYFSIAAFFVLFISAITCWKANRGCSWAIYGWDWERPLCSPTQTWKWLMSGGDWLAWGFIAANIVIIIWFVYSFYRDITKDD